MDQSQAIRAGTELSSACSIGLSTRRSISHHVSSYLEFMPSGRTAVRRESSRHNGLNPMKIDVQRHY
jgi:hypothetical protein